MTRPCVPAIYCSCAFHRTGCRQVLERTPWPRLHTRSTHAATKDSRCIQACKCRQDLRLHQEGRGRRSQRVRAAEAGGASVDPGRGDGASEEEVTEGERKSQRFASWREATLICVLVHLVRKMGALFASFCWSMFLSPKALWRTHFAFASCFANSVEDGLSCKYKY